MIDYEKIMDEAADDNASLSRAAKEDRIAANKFKREMQLTNQKPQAKIKENTTTTEDKQMQVTQEMRQELADYSKYKSFLNTPLVQTEELDSDGYFKYTIVRGEDTVKAAAYLKHEKVGAKVIKLDGTVDYYLINVRCVSFTHPTEEITTEEQVEEVEVEVVHPTEEEITGHVDDTMMIILNRIAALEEDNKLLHKKIDETRTIKKETQPKQPVDKGNEVRMTAQRARDERKMPTMGKMKRYADVFDIDTSNVNGRKKAEKEALWTSILEIANRFTA